MNVPRLLGAGFAGALLLVAGGCSDPVVQMMTAPKIAECKGFDTPLQVLAGRSRKELRARVLGHDVDQDFPFVVETGPGSVVLIGFTPVGTKAFTLVRRGDKVVIENITGAPLVVPPRNLMADMLAVSMPSRCATTTAPVTASRVGNWQINDTCQGARPVERRIARPGGGVEVEITYAKNAILLRHNRCGYSARYILQATAPPATVGGDFSDEDER